MGSVTLGAVPFSSALCQTYCCRMWCQEAWEEVLVVFSIARLYLLSRLAYLWSASFAGERRSIDAATAKWSALFSAAMPAVDSGGEAEAQTVG